MSNPHPRVCSVDSVARQLEARRRDMGLSVAEVAKLAGYHENTVLRVLHGAQNVRWHTLRHVAEVLGYDITLTSADENQPAA